MKKTFSLVLILALGLPAGVANADFTFGTPTNLGPTVNSSAIDGYPAPSTDGRMLYFSSNRPGGAGGIDLWQIPMTPIVDFNGDGIVDAADIVRYG